MTVQPSRQRALVTGATGFLGRRLVGHLQQAGWVVAALARHPTATALPALRPGLHVYPYGGSTSNVVDAVAAFLPRVVFHLASFFVSEHDSDQVEPLLASNILLGTQVLEAMRAAGGVGVLVNAGTSWQTAAGAEHHPANLYAATKQAFESVLAYYVEQAGVSAVTLRLFDTYGPGDTRPKLIPLLLRSLRTGEPLSMSPGDQVIDLVHVDDVCRAFLQAADLACEQTAGAQVYAAGGGERRTLRKIVATLEEAAGRKLPVTFGTRPYRTGEIMTPWDGPPLPGWAPQITLAQGLRELLIAEGLA